MGAQASKRYLALSTHSERVSESSDVFRFRFRVYAPTNDGLKPSARFEVRKIDDAQVRILTKQFLANNSMGDRVVLRCHDGTISPHQEILRCAWSGFLNGRTSFRTDFNDYRLLDIRHLVWFIYTNGLPSEQNELLSLLAVSHRIGYKSLSRAGARKIVDLCADLDESRVNNLIQHTRRLELKFVYDRLCVVLARNFQRKQLMHSLDVDILKDILSQDCLAVFSEDDVCRFIEEYANMHGRDVPLGFARCLRYKFLKKPASCTLPFREIFQDHFASPRDSFRPFYMSAWAKFRHKGSTLTVKFGIEFEKPDGKTKKLCSMKQHSNNLQATKSSSEFLVAIASCSMIFFVLLGKSLVQIDPSTHACSVICRDVLKLEASESPHRVEAVTRPNQRIVLCEGPISVLKTFRICTSWNGSDDPAIVTAVESDSENLVENSLSGVIEMDEKTVTE